jgi:hypothetical protein
MIFGISLAPYNAREARAASPVERHGDVFTKEGWEWKHKNV